jgi:hypothetical protein
MPRKTNFGGYGPFSAPNVPVDEAVTVQDLSGQVFYVNANATGDDDVDTPFPVVDEALCFSTLQAAIDATVASRGDTIIVKRGSETSVTTPVLFNKQGIRVITQRWGMSPSFRGEFTALLADATYTDGPVAQILDACYIEGLGFVSRDTGTTFYSGAALLIGGEATAEPYGVHLFQCRFPKWNVGNSKGIAIEGSTDCLIEECYFEGVGADFATGIYLQGAMQNLEIRGCRFRDCDYQLPDGCGLQVPRFRSQHRNRGCVRQLLQHRGRDSDVRPDGGSARRPGHPVLGESLQGRARWGDLVEDLRVGATRPPVRRDSMRYNVVAEDTLALIQQAEAEVLPREGNQIQDRGIVYLVEGIRHVFPNTPGVGSPEIPIPAVMVSVIP